MKLRFKFMLVLGLLSSVMNAKTIALPEIDLNSVPTEVMTVLNIVLEEGDSLVQRRPPLYIVSMSYNDNSDKSRGYHLTISLIHKAGGLSDKSNYIGHANYKNAIIIFRNRTDISLKSKKPTKIKTYQIETGLPVVDGYSYWRFLIKGNEITRISHVGHW